MFFAAGLDDPNHVEMLHEISAGAHAALTDQRLVFVDPAPRYADLSAAMTSADDMMRANSPLRLANVIA
jgi:hypothetical protein